MDKMVNTVNLHVFALLWKHLKKCPPASYVKCSNLGHSCTRQSYHQSHFEMTYWTIGLSTSVTIARTKSCSWVYQLSIWSKAACMWPWCHGGSIYISSFTIKELITRPRAIVYKRRKFWISKQARAKWLMEMSFSYINCLATVYNCLEDKVHQSTKERWQPYTKNLEIVIDTNFRSM